MGELFAREVIESKEYAVAMTFLDNDCNLREVAIDSKLT